MKLRTLPLIAILIALAVFSVPVSMVRGDLASGTLADAMGTIINANSWNPTTAQCEVPHYATVFSVGNPSYYQTAAQLAPSYVTPVEVLHTARLAELDGSPTAVSSATIQAYLSSVAMTGSLPITYNGYCLMYHRYMAEFLLDKQGALSQIANIVNTLNPYNYYDHNGQPGPGTYIGYTSSSGWITYYRYYDDTMETVEFLLQLGGDYSVCDKIWAFANGLSPYSTPYFWNGLYYGYNGQSGMETEVGPFALISGRYLLTAGTFNTYKDRIVSDLNQKLLISGYSSPLWNHYSLNHVPAYDERRLENAVAAWAAMQAYYPVMTSAMQATLQGMCGVGWKGLLSQSGDFYPASNMFGWRNDGVTSMAATGAGLMYLFLNGVVPVTGSLAVPLNDEQYEDTTSWNPATMFRFDYAAHQIRIPVNAGQLNFVFGSGTATYTFPSTGVYSIQFSSDWNTVVSTNRIGDLDAQFKYVPSGSSPPPPPSSGTLTVTASYNGSYVATQVTASGSQTYTGTTTTDPNAPLNWNVTAGTYSVSGTYNGVSNSTVVAVGNGQTTHASLNFGGQEPNPNPNPNPGLSQYDLVFIVVSGFGVVGLVLEARHIQHNGKGYGRVRIIFVSSIFPVGEITR